MHKWKRKRDYFTTEIKYSWVRSCKKKKNSFLYLLPQKYWRAVFEEFWERKTRKRRRRVTVYIQWEGDRDKRQIGWRYMRSCWHSVTQSCKGNFPLDVCYHLRVTGIGSPLTRFFLQNVSAADVYEGGNSRQDSFARPWPCDRGRISWLPGIFSDLLKSINMYQGYPHHYLPLLVVFILR